MDDGARADLARPSTPVSRCVKERRRVCVGARRSIIRPSRRLSDIDIRRRPAGDGLHHSSKHVTTSPLNTSNPRIKEDEIYPRERKRPVEPRREDEEDRDDNPRPHGDAPWTRPEIDRPPPPDRLH